jgi:hypothetical protein
MLLAARFNGLLTKPVAQSYTNPAGFIWLMGASVAGENSMQKFLCGVIRHLDSLGKPNLTLQTIKPR